MTLNSSPPDRHRDARFAVALGVVLVLQLGNARAQDLEPQKYINAPVGQNFLRLAYSRSEGDVNISPALPLEDAYISRNDVSLAYLRTMSFGGNAMIFDAYIPHICASGSAVYDGERQSRDVCGFGDALFRVSYNFIGAPALALSDFAKRKKEIVVGASVQVSVPIGQYDSDYVVNIGTNRWVIRPEVGMSIPWQNWSLEFAAGVRLFGDNDDYVGDATLSQDPLYNLQAHIVYNLTRRQWISLDANYFFGGVTYIDNAQSAIAQENSRLGVVWSVALNRNFVVTLAAHTGVVTRVGNDSDTFTGAVLYRWE